MNDFSQLTKKAESGDFLGRFREIVSDPLNLAINRHPLAGFVEKGFVILHNGIRVPVGGKAAYYGDFSQILVINRGAHEPLEEYVFQEVLKVMPEAPLMLELGAYWGHYSMWLKLMRPNAQVHMVEPEPRNLEAGKHNFAVNNLQGEFVKNFVGKGFFEVDQYLAEKSIDSLDILHSDIQGYELEMLDGAARLLTNKRVNYVFVSTHSQDLHHSVIRKLSGLDYRVEVSSDYDNETTSFDGFVFASNPLAKPIFMDFSPLSRRQILEASPKFQAQYITQLIDQNNSSESD